MAGEPKKKHSKTVKRIRRGAIKLAASSLVVCSNCNSKTFPHQVCKSCGYYAGKKVSEGQVKVTRA